MSDAAITKLSANEPRDSEATQASSGWVPATAKSSRAAQGEAPGQSGHRKSDAEIPGRSAPCQFASPP